MHADAEIEKLKARVSELERRLEKTEAALRMLNEETGDKSRCSEEFGHHVSSPCRALIDAAGLCEGE